MSRDDATVLDLLKAARLAVEFVGGLDRDGFLGDLKTQSAVVHQLLILGEGVKRLSDGFRSSHPEIPWRMIAGMRDKLIHAYDEVDLDEVWKTVTADVPPLIARLEPLASPRPPRGGDASPSSETTGA
jgi:uncharacterized protein with HEPN domain